jgi:FkbM family methyltransferase
MRGELLDLLARSERIRSFYSRCRRVPLLGSSLHRVVHSVLPYGSRIWIQIPEAEGKGLWFYADPRFEVGYLNGDHEPWLQDVLRERLRPGDCFYDVGAHTGFFSLIAARRVGEEGVVIALEPDPDNAAVLRVNLAKNQVRQVKVIEAAAWSATGEVSFEQASRASNRTQGRVIGSGNGGTQKIAAPAVCLDDLVFLRGERPPRLIKMDIEGGEWEALLGARRLLREVQPDLLCEVHDPDEIRPLQAFLAEFGYAEEHWAPLQARYPDYRQNYLWAAVP